MQLRGDHLLLHKLIVFVRLGTSTCIKTEGTRMLDTKNGMRSHEITNTHQNPKKEPFNNALWREMLNSTSDEVGSFFNLEIEAISPFGFEILMSKKFLYGTLRRLYCYMGTKKNIPGEMQIKVIQYFYEILMQTIASKYPLLFEEPCVRKLKTRFCGAGMIMKLAVYRED